MIKFYKKSLLLSLLFVIPTSASTSEYIATLVALKDYLVQGVKDQTNHCLKHYNEIALAGYVGMNILAYRAISSSGEALEDHDPFKIMVLEECANVGLADGYPKYVRVSGHPLVESMITCTLIDGGIVVAKSFYDAFFQEQTDARDKDVFKWWIRHEASHIKHADALKIAVCGGLVFVSVLYGFDYLFNQIMRQFNQVDIEDSLTCNLIKSWSKSLLLCCAQFGLIYTQRYAAETRADREACGNAPLALAGSRSFERLAAYCSNDERMALIQSNPMLCRLLTGYPTCNERAQTLQQIAEQLA